MAVSSQNKTKYQQERTNCRNTYIKVVVDDGGGYVVTEIDTVDGLTSSECNFFLMV